MRRPVNQIIDQLCGTFRPIYQQWINARPTHLNLWETTRTLDDRAILEDDIRQIGFFFAQADQLGARSEFAMLAECIALIRLYESQLPADNLLEHEIDKAYTMLMPIITASQQSQMAPVEPLHVPHCWRITQHMHSSGKTSSPALQGIQDALLDLADTFLIRDGNLTGSEQAKYNQFKQLLES